MSSKEVLTIIFIYWSLCIPHSHAKPIVEIDLNTSIQTQQAGHDFLRLLTRSGYIIEDVELQIYLENLGQYLRRFSQMSRGHFTFFLIDDNSINAFAGPYGYIGIHSGLIIKTEQEAELAAVIAHEIAHVSQHHLKRYEEKMSGQNYWLATAILASILAKDTEVGEAILSSSIAASAQRSINFTRAHEKEADRFGVELLQRTRFNPQGMADFFKKLNDEKGAIEYLRTHPLSLSRIADTLQILAHQTTRTYRSSLDYELTKARLYYHIFNQINLSNNPTANRYMLAYDLLNKQQYRSALKMLEPLLNHSSTFVAILAMRLYQQLGQVQKAISIGQKVYQDNPNNSAIIYYLASGYEYIGKTQTAITILKQFIRRSTVSYQLYSKLAMLYLKDGQLDKYHINQAFSLVKKGAYQDAIIQLEQAKNHARHQDTRSLAKTYIQQIKRVQNLLGV